MLMINKISVCTGIGLTVDAPSLDHNYAPDCPYLSQRSLKLHSSHTASQSDREASSKRPCHFIASENDPQTSREFR